jgi:branched-chain amino acid transport system ATP-binding protein
VTAYREASNEIANRPPLLRIRGVTVRFGAIVALNEVSFDVQGGEILGLIGPNGAGKTTLFNCLSRLAEVECGTIELDGRSLLSAPHSDTARVGIRRAFQRLPRLLGLNGGVTILFSLLGRLSERERGTIDRDGRLLRGVPRYDIARVGIGRTFQHLALFETMSVIDNVLVGTHVRGQGGFLADAFRLPFLVHQERRVRTQAMELLERLDLAAIANVRVGGLPFAVKKRVELARALAAEPKLLLLDEPAGGLNHEEVERLGDQIRLIRKELGVTILMVEHHLNFVMRVSDRVVVLDFGRTLAEGTPAEMQAHPEVIRAYLGASA